MLNYLQIFPETKAMVQRYKPEDRCYLYEAMMEYAFTGNDPEWPDDDMKWFVWETLKQTVKRADAARERKQAAGRASAEQRTSTERNRAQQNATESNRAQQAATEANPESESDTESDTDTETERENAQARRARSREQEVMFDRFWTAYPRHTSKAPARKAFAKLNPDDALLSVMLDAIERQKASAQWSDPQYIPHPSTWINQRRWEDEVVQSKPKAEAGTHIAQLDYSQREYEETPLGDLPDWYVRMLEEEQGKTAEDIETLRHAPQWLLDSMVEEARK